MNKSILIVEGEDEKDIILALADKLGISVTTIDEDGYFDFQANVRLLVNGRDKALVEAMHTAASDQYVQKIGIICDSEEAPAKTATTLLALASVATQVRSDIQYLPLQLPSSTEVGSLEKICLSTIDKDDPLLLCSNAFIECVGQHAHKLTTTARKDKARFATWYAAKTGKQISRLGIDVQPRGQNILNLGDDAFKPIVAFLQQLTSHV